MSEHDLIQDFKKDGFICLPPPSIEFEEWACDYGKSIDDAVCKLETSHKDDLRIDISEYKIKDSPKISGAQKFLKNILRDSYQNIVEEIPSVWQLSSALAGYPRNNNPHLRQAFDRHVDGAGKKNKKYAYTASPFILGILLTDLAYADCGNPVVWPRSHRLMKDVLSSEPISSMEGCMKEGVVVDRIYNAIKYGVKADPNDALQIIGKGGTILIYHYLLAHGIAPNLSDVNRHVIFWRGEAVKVDDCIDPKRVYKI